MRDNEDEQRAPRISTNQAATLIHLCGKETPVVVTDLSKGGFRLLMKSPPPVGERIRLRTAKSVEYVGTIMWVNQSEAGGSFVESVGEV